MTMISPASAAPRAGRPLVQRFRILTLRALFVLAAVPVLWGVPIWHGAAGAVLTTAGIFCVFAAVLGRFWSILYIGGRKDAEVMQDGPYSVARHPLYLFSTLGVVGFGLLLQSVTLALLMGGTVGLVLWLTARHEERSLTRSFGAAYADYARRVPRMLPRPALFATPRRISVDTDTLRTNAADALVFLSTIPVAAAIRTAHESGLLHGFRLY